MDVNGEGGRREVGGRWVESQRAELSSSSLDACVVPHVDGGRECDEYSGAGKAERQQKKVTYRHENRRDLTPLPYLPAKWHR